MHKEYKTLKVKDLRPYENNPRINDNAVEAVKESIRQCGYISPIVVDSNNEILAGHTRYKALKEMGVKEAECLVVTGLTSEAKKKYRILDNKTNELASFDFAKLEVELEGLDFEGFDFGLDIDTIDYADIDAYDELDGETGGGNEIACPACGFRFEV